MMRSGFLLFQEDALSGGLWKFHPGNHRGHRLGWYELFPRNADLALATGQILEPDGKKTNCPAFETINLSPMLACFMRVLMKISGCVASD
jgi:hypothetical protein|tara:strand:+ start:1403 stop:1672 length:270 start_codon:yes stop_codon:yes gene_type:complete